MVFITILCITQYKFMHWVIHNRCTQVKFYLIHNIQSRIKVGSYDFTLVDWEDIKDNYTSNGDKNQYKLKVYSRIQISITTA